MNERTRTFNATYTSNDNKKHQLNVKVFRRLASFGLALTLVGSMTGCHLLGHDKDTVSKQYEQTFEEADLELINSIIRNNPDMLKIKKRGEYTVGFGDTLSGIAEANGNTVKRIAYLNKIENASRILMGQKLVVETITRIEGIDADILCLESYFHDYVLNSRIGAMAKSNETDRPQDSYLRNLIYGEPKNTSEVDPNSIFGRFINAYKDYHQIEEPTEDNKRAYVEELLDIEKDLTETLSSYMGNVLEPYSKYKVYMTNGTTKYDTIEEKRHTVYD